MKSSKSPRKTSFLLQMAWGWLSLLTDVYVAVFAWILILGWTFITCPEFGLALNLQRASALLGTLSLAFAVSAYRLRLDAFGRVLRGVAIVCGTGTACMLLEAVFGSLGYSAAGSSIAKVWRLFQVFLIDVGGLVLIFWELRRGLRARHRAVPQLIQTLTTGGKGYRRIAIVILGNIEQTDRLVARRDGAVWVRWLRQWFNASETDSGLFDAIPTLEAALRDKDLFVRAHAAKVLARVVPPPT